MMKHNYIYILGIICLTMMTSCLEETSVFEPSGPGDEVQFSLGISKNAQTKTIYGDLTAGTHTTSALKVNWVADDQIAIYGTKCDRKTGEYVITPNSSDASKAETVTKTGAAGVQWGTGASDFYAIYPSNGQTEFEPFTDGVMIPTAIRSQQPNIFSKTGSSWRGTPCLSSDKSKFTMVDNIMYAYSGDVSSEQGGVSLNFKPYSSVLNFKLAGWENKSNGAINPMQITKITLNGGQTKLAGNFKLSLNGNTPSVIADDISSTAATSIDILPGLTSGSYITIQAGESLEFYVFIIPQAGVSIGEGWSVSLTTSHGTFQYPLSASTGANTKIEPGQIHVINIPAIPLTSNGDGGGDISDNPGNWITKVDPTIYLSELSLPGAWYCYDSNYQEVTDLSQLYGAGVRAFHIDCRLSPTSITFSGGLLSGSATATGSELVCAGTDKVEGGMRVSDSKFTRGKSVIQQLIDISKFISSDEYVIVVLNIAEKPLSWSDPRAGQDFGSIKPLDVLAEIDEMLTKGASDFKLYTNKITPYTTVNEVLNHMIVKVNVNTTEDIFGTYESLPSTLLSFASLTSDDKYATGDIKMGDFISMKNSNMYWGKDENGTLTDTGIEYYYIQAQQTDNSENVVTSGTPSIGTRKKAIDNIIQESKTQYASSKHNKWFQMGIGGYIGDGGHDSVAEELNDYLLNKIENKISSDPSPVGIVLMNNCINGTTTNIWGQVSEHETYGPSLIDAILRLNESFIMKRTSEANETTLETRSATSDNKKLAPVLNPDGSESGWMKAK